MAREVLRIAAQKDPTMNPQIPQLPPATAPLSNLIVYGVLQILAILVVLLPIAIPIWMRWSAQSSQRARGDALRVLTDLAQQYVWDAMRLVRDAKNPLTPGEWTAESAGRLLAEGMEYVQRNAPRELERVMGDAAESQSPQDFLRRLLEAQVQRAKAMSATADATTIAVPVAVVAESPPKA